jgi:spermidine/putrescine transport system permease protein
MKNLSKWFSPLFASAIYLFLYVPIAVLIVFSFNSKGFPSPFENFTFHWYHELFQTTELWLSFFNSLMVSTISTGLSLLLGVMLLYFQALGGKIEKSLSLFYGNLVIPETVLALGLISYFSFFDIPLGMHTLIVSHTVLGLGFVVPILYVRAAQLDTRLTEASLVLGATPAQTFFKITLPQLKPAMISIGLLVFVISFDDFILSYFCSGTSFQTLSIYLISSIRFGISPVVNALSAILLLATSLFVCIFFSPKIRTRIF